METGKRIICKLLILLLYPIFLLLMKIYPRNKVLKDMEILRYFKERR